MKIIISFLTTLLALLPKADLLVVTTYDANTVGGYFLHFKSQDKIKNKFTDLKLFEYCHILRQSRIFHVREEGTLSQNYFPGLRLIPEDIIRMEKNAELKEMQLRIGNSKSIPNEQLKTLNCSSVDQQEWYITAAFISDSAFLYTLIPDNKLIFKTTRGIPKPQDIWPRLAAIIDESATIKRRSSTIENFIESVRSSEDGAETLCMLEPLVQFRLCAISADAYDRIDATFIGDNVTSQVYHDRFYNFYDRPENPVDKCPLKTFNLRRNPTGIRNITHNFLYCSVWIEKTNHKFYLSLNILEEFNLVFSVREFPEKRNEGALIEEIQIPLLNQLTRYMKLDINIIDNSSDDE